VIFRSTLRQPRKSRAISLFCSASLRSTSRIHYPPNFRIPYLPSSVLLPSSVSRKSFVCRSCENCRGVYQFFPIRNSSRVYDVQTFSPAGLQTCLLSIPFAITLLRTLLRFFALKKNSTLFFSNDSALFAKNNPGWGYRFYCALRAAWRKAFGASRHGSPSPLPGRLVLG